MNQQSTGVSRRETMKWAGLAGIAMFWAHQAGKSAVAQELTTPTTTPVSKAPEPQGAGYYRFSHGQMVLTLISDGQLPLPDLFPTVGANVGKESVDRALEAAFISPGPAWLHVNGLVVQSGDSVLLIDTGSGNMLGPTLGKLMGNLANAGIKPEDITHVLITHLHRDHVGGLFDAQGNVRFPKAKVFVHEQEHNYWSQPEPDLSKSGIAESAREEFIKTLQKAAAQIKPIATLLEGQETEIIPGVTSVHAPGHTAGHQIVRIVSGDSRLIYISDLVHYPAVILPHPDWYVAFDTDRQAAAQARAKHLEEFASNRVLLSGGHIPFPGLGHARKVGDGYEWVPALWKW